MKNALKLFILFQAAVLLTCSNKLQDKYSNKNIPSDYKPEKNGICMIYGSHHVFSVITPDGWLLDRKIAGDNNLGSFFYPESSTDPMTSYMYANGFSKDELNPNINEFIKGDIKTFKKDNPDLIVEKIGTIITHDSSLAEVYEFSNLVNTAGERIAYIDAPGTSCVIVFSSKDKEQYNKYLEAFQTLVKTYHFLSDDPEKALKVYKKLYDKK